MTTAKEERCLPLLVTEEQALLNRMRAINSLYTQKKISKESHEFQIKIYRTKLKLVRMELKQRRGPLLRANPFKGLEV